MIKVKLNGKLAVGKNKIYFHKSNSVGTTNKLNKPTKVQEGMGFKSVPNSNSKINIEPNKKLDKFINFKL